MLAIIIPYFKITFFEETLASLAAQTCKDFKVYIGNDASPESPNNLLKKFTGIFDFAYHSFDENLGGTNLTQQWDRCIALSANEEWIMILGDDDIIGENVVEAFYENIKFVREANINVIRFATVKINTYTASTSKIYLHPRVESSLDFFVRMYKGETRCSLSEYIFQRSSYNAIGFKNFPLAWHADVLAVIEFSNFENVFTINAATVSVRISNLSLSGNPNLIKAKYKASALFYCIILDNINRFKNSEQKFIYTIIEKNYLNNKKDFNYYLKIIRCYLNNFKFKEILILNYKMLCE